MKIILFICLASFSLKGYNQDTVKTTLIIFDQDNINTVTNNKDTSIQKNALKVNPLLYVRGEIPIYYERALNNYFSVEAAIGITFKDYTSGLFDDGNSFGESKEEKINSNVSFKLGLRYYSGGVVMDGFYFALEFAKRDYSKDLTFTITDNIYNATTGTSTTITSAYNFKESDNHQEFKLIVGSQEHYYWDNVFVDYYIGAGIDKYTEVKVNSESNATTNKYDYSLKTSSKTAPRFYLGLKFGFMF